MSVQLTPNDVLQVGDEFKFFSNSSTTYSISTDDESATAYRDGKDIPGITPDEIDWDAHDAFMKRL